MVISDLTQTQWRACRLIPSLMSDRPQWRYQDGALFDDVRDALARAAHLNAQDREYPEAGDTPWYVIQQGVGR